MVSIGDLTYGGKLVLDDLEVKNAISTPNITGSTAVSGSVTSSHKQVGSDDKNLVQIHQNGSIFYLKWSHVEEINSFETTINSQVVIISVTGHGLQNGDTVHIEDFTGVPDINGIPSESIQGARLVTQIDDSELFRFNAGAIATSTGVVNNVNPLIRVDRYKRTDMAQSNATWVCSTTEPAPSHTNIREFKL
jgi:hypothetical protein